MARGMRIFGLVLLCHSGAALAGDPWRAFWIWDRAGANLAPQPAGDRFFRKSFELDSPANQSHTLVLADNSFTLFVNGRRVSEGKGFWPPAELDIRAHLQAGRNVIAIQARNDDGPAGLMFECNLKTRRGDLVNLVTDGSWKSSGQAVPGWEAPNFNDAEWPAAVVLGGMGTPPWGNYGKPGGTGSTPVADKPLSAAESLRRFTVPADFKVEIVADEPEVINPVGMAVDEHGRLYVAEAHTYRWGAEKSPVQPPRNPVVRLELDAEGRARRKAVVADGFADPVMGILVRDGRIWLAQLNQLLTGTLQPDGRAVDLKVIVRDTAVPWNPFGMYRLAFGPDGWIYMIVGDHQIEMIGADGVTLRSRGSTGAMFRLRPDGTGLQMLSQGMRAPFSFDFDAYGRLWILSNGEGNPNRLLLNIPTADYHFHTRHGDWAWLAGTHPWSPPVTEMERGANTQVLCWFDRGFPKDYWGSIFVANWGAHGYPSVNHKIDLYQPDENGQITNVRVFLDSTDPMFRPTQLSCSPDGQMYMLDWYGKDDENDLTGRIYKIVYTGSQPIAPIIKRPFDAGPGLAADESRALLDLQSTHRHQREAALQLLAGRRNDAVVDAALQVLRDDQEPFISSQILWVLFRMGTPKAVDAISEAVQTKHHLLRAMVVRLLRELNPPDLLKRLDPLNDDPDPETRVELALCRPNADEVINSLLAALDAGAIKDRRLRYQCAMGLSRRMPVDQYLALARHSDPLKAMVAWIAIDIACLEQTNPAGREALGALLKDPPAGRAAEVLELCRQWARPDMISALQAFLDRGEASPAQLATAMEILRRFGPDATAGIAATTARRFVEGVGTGEISLGGPQDRISLLNIIDTVEMDRLAGEVVQECVQDGVPEVRLRALQTIRMFGWQQPWLFSEAWAIITQSDRPLRERLSAIATVAAQDPPDSAGWRRLLGSTDPAMIRMALRTLKQLAGDDEISKLVIERTPELITQDADLAGELTALLAILGADETTRNRLKLPRSVSAMEPSELARQALERLPSARTSLGEQAFGHLGCTACHNVTGAGKTFGPSLKDIGKANTPAYILESVLDPNKTIKDGFDLEEITLDDGQTLQGYVEDHVQGLAVICGVNERISITKDQLLSRRKLSRSPMPQLTLDGVSLGELTDLLAYLVSQGGDPKAAHARK